MVDHASVTEVLKNDSVELVVLGALLIAGSLFLKRFLKTRKKEGRPRQWRGIRTESLPPER